MGALEKRKLKSGISWRFVYRDAAGRQKKVKIGVTSKRVAEQRKAQLEAMLAMGKDPADELRTHGAITLSELMDTDAAWAANRLQPRTVQLNREIMNRFIAWAGDVQLKQIDKAKVEKYLKYCAEERRYKATTINMHRRQLASIFQRAIGEHGLVKTNPFHGIKPFTDSVRRDRADYLELDQVDTLLKVTAEDVPFQQLVRFYLLTGARRGEALDLLWSDVDLNRRILYLGQERSQTKLRRDFPIRDKLHALLIELQKDREDHAEVFWRFAGRNSYVSNRVGALKKRDASLPDSLSPHLLRHTFASHMVMQGVDLRTVASLLGHSTEKVTELYAHLAEEHREKALDRLPY
ncbi:tyrosine-type recombinase/integrase [bacterium]|nr:tyrosine-type recombinase/integrase [bacterium]